MPTSKQDPSASGIDPHKLFTDQEVADLMGISVWHVRNLIRDGRIGYVKTGPKRGRRISGRDYLDYLERNRVEAAA
jgi:excisionase family DNA binding protein